MQSLSSPSRPLHLLLATQLLLWWLANNLYAIDAQTLLKTPHADPFLFIDLTFAHVFVGLCIGILFYSFLSPTTEQQRSLHSQSFTPTAVVVACLHLVGTVLTNASYRSIGATATLVWKLTEPLATIALKFFLLGERTSLLSFIGVQAVLFGVLLFSANSLTVVAVSPILIANLAFPTRNVLLKKIQRTHGEPLSIAHRFLALYLPAFPLAALALVAKLVLFGSSASFIPQLLKNAALFNTYQLASLLVLERIDALTHSLANTLKRFTGIVLAALYFAEPLDVQHAIGLMCTVFGFPMYAFGSVSAKDITTRKKALFGRVLVLFVAFCSVASTFAFYASLTEENSAKIEHEVKAVLSPASEGTQLFSDESLSTLAPNPIVHVEQKYRELHGHIFRSYEEAKHFDDGDNTGNFVWQHSAYRVLPDFSRSTTCNDSRTTCFKRHVADSSRVMVAYRPAANFFNKKRIAGFKYDLEGMRSFQTTPLIFGIGVQDYFTKNSTNVDFEPGRKIETSPEDFEFSESAKELLRTMQDRKHPMLFRGDFTLKAAQKAGYTYGISNGCPSLMMNEDVRLGQTLERNYAKLGRRAGDTSLKVAISIKEGRRFRMFYKGILDQYPNSFIYAQGKGDLVVLEKAGVPFERIRMFNNVNDRRESMREMDVAIGARIHGNMLAIGVSVPTFVLAPDHRVLELVKKMKIPHVSFFSSDLPTNDVDVAKLVAEAGFDGKEFDVNRCNIAKTFRKEFGRYGIQVSRHVRKISDIC